LKKIDIVQLRAGIDRVCGDLAVLLASDDQLKKAAEQADDGNTVEVDKADAYSDAFIQRVCRILAEQLVSSAVTAPAQSDQPAKATTIVSAGRPDPASVPALPAASHHKIGPHPSLTDGMETMVADMDFRPALLASWKDRLPPLFRDSEEMRLCETRLSGRPDMFGRVLLAYKNGIPGLIDDYTSLIAMGVPPHEAGRVIDKITKRICLCREFVCRTIEGESLAYPACSRELGDFLNSLEMDELATRADYAERPYYGLFNPADADDYDEYSFG
jgi:hypothetical protein